jgi:epoxide hydrolase
MQDPTELRPYRIAIPDAALADLHERLARTRWPAEVAGLGWTRGVPGPYLRDLVDHWRTGYDWRAHEAALNRHPQLTTELDGETVHLLHVRSARPGARPLLLLHGWPGSIVEYVGLIEELIAPKEPGAPAFHVVLPSLPGFGFLGSLRSAGWSTERMAAAFAALMQRLGYARYFAHGGDTGAMIARELGVCDAAHVAAIHVTQIFSFAPPDGEPRDEHERRSREALERYEHQLSGYMHVQAQTPLTLGYALEDSPVGQLAWILDIFKKFSACADRPDEVIDRDTLLTNASIYWLTGTATSSSQVYAEASAAWSEPQRCEVPMGVAVFPADPLLTVRHVAAPMNHIVHFTQLERGGHFASLEQPELLLADLRGFFARFG